jgi:hypothetical protein
MYTLAITYSSKANLIAKVVKAANAILGVLKVVVLDEPKAKQELVERYITCR